MVETLSCSVIHVTSASSHHSWYPLHLREVYSTDDTGHIPDQHHTTEQSWLHTVSSRTQQWERPLSIQHDAHIGKVIPIHSQPSPLLHTFKPTAAAAAESLNEAKYFDVLPWDKKTLPILIIHPSNHCYLLFDVLYNLGRGCIQGRVRKWQNLTGNWGKTPGGYT